MDKQVLDWLLEGDPAIRWQVMRDLLDVPESEWQSERQKVASEGWGAHLLSRQDADGKWAGGIYGPKWTSTTYTLLLLRHLGLPNNNPQAQKACAHFISKGIYRDGGINLFKSLDYSELCVNGMILALLSYFRWPDLSLHRSMIEYLLREQMDDGGWNCERPNGATHSSFHTTLSVLEGIEEYIHYDPKPDPAIGQAVARTHEFLLEHRIYKSHRTGNVADPAMARIYFPPRWRYDHLRALDYFQWINAPRDPRMQDAIDLLLSRQTTDGRWKQYTNWAGRTFFTLEPVSQPGRFNTLRALRVLKWWQNTSG